MGESMPIRVRSIFERKRVRFICGIHISTILRKFGERKEELREKETEGHAILTHPKISRS